MSQESIRVHLAFICGFFFFVSSVLVPQWLFRIPVSPIVLATSPALPSLPRPLGEAARLPRNATAAKLDAGRDGATADSLRNVRRLRRGEIGLSHTGVVLKVLDREVRGGIQELERSLA